MIKIIVSMVLIFFSLSAWSEKIVVHGKPVELQQHLGFFTFPDTYTHYRQGYHFVTFTGADRVCYIQEKPELVSLDMVRIVIEEEGKKINWNCYKFDPRFFEVDF
ncbi:hypothetical protein [Legionella nagasakiensis]|uniref:hypothetical protein n=1 Tax=Legionella nagasakiensis TaxID=535290 RepID=UPI001055C070|nr:hypothetical protein [Legionella nagasakiensis]